MLYRLTLCAAALVFLASSARAAEPVRVNAIAGIYAAAPDAQEAQAVTLLQTVGKRLFGVDLTALKEMPPADAARVVIVVGKRAAIETRSLSEADFAPLGPEGSRIVCGDGRIVIAGGNGWATYCGAVSFLNLLGVRFFVTDVSKAAVPQTPLTSIEPFSITDRPFFDFRSGIQPIFRASRSQLGDPRKGLNPELFDPKKTGSDLWIDHSAGYLVPKLLYYDPHPEYYAMDKDGKRIAKTAFSDHRTPLCLSNADVSRIATERAVAWIEMNPGQRFFMVTYGDTGFWCQCPECLKLDPAPGEYATRLLHWVNAVAKGVAVKHPDKVLMTFAYSGSNKPPATARPDKNVRIVVATGNACAPFWDHAAAANALNLKNIEEWIAVAPNQVMVCEYLGAYEPAMLPKTANRLAYYRGIGLQGIFATYGAPPNFRPVWEYVWSRMTWDPQQDVNALASDFIRFNYGAAAEPVIRLFDLARVQYETTLKAREPLVDNYPPGFYTPDFVNASLDCFRKAVDAVGADAAMKKQLQVEEGRFLSDVVQHMPAYDLSEESNRTLLGYLDAARTLAKETGEKLSFYRNTQSLAVTLEKKRAGYRELIEKWLGDSAELQPITIANGLRFTPEMFRGCDYGPEQFPSGTAKSHPDFPCPPKVCAGVYMKTKGGRGQETSSRMTVDFDLAEVPADRQAVLELEGQDAMSHWMDGKNKDWKTSIQILVNEKVVFSGECGFVRGNWSLRQFPLPAGCLKAGRNQLAIRNISPRGWFAGCWFLVSNATLTFPPATPGK